MQKIMLPTLPVGDYYRDQVLAAELKSSVWSLQIRATADITGDDKLDRLMTPTYQGIRDLSAAESAFNRIYAVAQPSTVICRLLL